MYRLKVYQKSANHIITAILLFAVLTVFYGCAEDKSSSTVEIDIPENDSWNIYEIHNTDPDQTIPLRLTFTNSNDTVYMSYYDHNPLFDPANEVAYPFKYRIRYKSFRLGDAAALSSAIIDRRQDYQILRKIYLDELEVYEKALAEYQKELDEYDEAVEAYNVAYQAYLATLDPNDPIDPNDPNAPVPPVAPVDMNLTEPVKPVFDNDNGTISGRAANETVTVLMDEGISMGDLSMDLSGTKPMIAYSVNDSAVYLPDYDLGNQGDVMIALKDGTAVWDGTDDWDGSTNWRSEIAAYGYCERNPVFRNGLAMNAFSLKGDAEGNALLSFQFYYEGADSYNFTYPDLKYISQPVDAFINENVDSVADLEETIEGSTFQLPSGDQKSAGDKCEMVINNDGNPVVFYYFSNLNAGPDNRTGLRTAVRIDGEWQAEWIHNNVEIVRMSAAVKSNGLLALAYTIKDYQDFDYIPNEIDDSTTIPYSIRYAEQVEVVTGTDTDGEDITEIQWKHESVDFVSICGQYCTLAMDSDDNPVVAFFDEMNFTETRFFSRIKIARRQPEGAWDTETIIPEAIGLTINTSPYEIDPGQHNAYYIGQYNYLWLDNRDKIYLCTYSSISKSAYLFQER